MASHVMKPGQSFPAGTVVSVYEDLGETRRDGPPSTPVITTATVTANSVLTFTGLEYGTRYWAVAQVAGVWTWVGFATDEASTNQLADDLSQLDSQVQVIAAAPLNVKSYGAVGDGVTDDTAAIQAAIAALPQGGANKGGAVFFPPGQYAYSAALNLDSKKNIVLEGAGANTDAAAAMLTWKGAAGSGSAISARASQGLVLRGLRLDYDSASYDGNLIRFGAISGTGTTLAKIEDCWIGGKSGLTSARCGLLADGANDVIVTNTSFQNSNVGIIGWDGNFSNVITVDGCLFNHMVAGAITNPQQAWTVRNTAFEPLTSGKAGALIQDDTVGGLNSVGLVVAGCWFGDTFAANGEWMNIRATGAIIAGNYMDATGQAGTSHITLDRCEGVNISGNSFYGGVNAAKILTSCDGLQMGPNKYIGTTNIVSNLSLISHLLLVGSGSNNNSIKGKTEFRGAIQMASADVAEGFLEGVEIAGDAAAPAADYGRLYLRDNGSGKTQLVARFATGAVQVIATQP